MGEGNMGLLRFADNCLIIAMTQAELKCVASAWNELLEKVGLRIAWEEAVGVRQHLTVCRRYSRCLTRVITRRSREQGFKALGAWITFDGHFVKEIAEREVYCMEVFLCDTTSFVCQQSGFETSFARSCHHALLLSMYWCSGSCMLTLSPCIHLRAIQDKMPRRMIEELRRATETS